MFKDIEFLRERNTNIFIDISMYRKPDFEVTVTQGECLVCDGVLHFVEDPYKYVEKCAASAEKNGLFLLVDKIVDTDDAETNAAEFFHDREHRRYYTVEEILDFTKDFFILEYFVRKNGKCFFIFIRR